MHNPNRGGLVFGTFLGGMHLLWSILVLLGWAQPLVNFSMWAHMIQTVPVIGPFDATAAVTVIVVAACVGYAVGYVLTTIWNRVHR